MGWGGSQNPLNSLCKLQGSLGSILPKKKKKISEQTRKKGGKKFPVLVLCTMFCGAAGPGIPHPGLPRVYDYYSYSSLFFFF